MVLRGEGVSGGRAAGPVFVAREEAPRRAAGGDLEAAVGAVSARLRALAQSASGRGASGAAILEAQAMMAEDPMLREAIEEARKRGLPAADAVSAGAEQVAAQLEQLEDDYLRARATDVREVGRLLRLQLSGASGGRLAGLAAPSIVVARELQPADLLGVDGRLLRGLVTEVGGRASHAAIVARELGIPAVANVAGALRAAARLRAAELDGDAGQVSFAARFEERARTEAPARIDLDLDSLPVALMANVGSAEGAVAAAQRGARGIGLFRTEFLFMSASGPLSEEEQLAVYRAACEAMSPHPVVVRTLDAGADKPLPYLGHDAEANPQLGRRGVRLWLPRPRLWRPQVRALLRAAADHPNLQVMAPLVAAREEMLAVRRHFEEEASDLGVGLPPLGMMVETPAAAAALEVFAGAADFVSLGTNDLTQYTVAADRELAWNQGLGVANPGVLRLIADAAATAQRLGMRAGACGEAAGQPPLAVFLAGAGVTSLSMTVDAIPAVAAAVRRLGAEGCRQAAQSALRSPTATGALTRLRHALA